MKIVYILLVIILLGANYFVLGQKTEQATGDNILRVNLSALVFRNISVEYERKISSRRSITLNIHTIPTGKLPYQTLAQKLVDKAYVDLNLAEIGSVGSTATYRFYGKKGAFRGMYLAPMINYNSYKSTLPIQYNTGKTGLFSGNINAITGGVQLGIQCKIAGRVYLDFWIIGPSYGVSWGKLSFNGALTVNDIAIIKAEIEDLKGSLPFYVISSYDINSMGGSIIEQGPWAGIRGLGINLGFRF